MVVVEWMDWVIGDNIAAVGGDEYLIEECCVGYYCSVKICYNNVCVGIVGY